MGTMTAEVNVAMEAAVSPQPGEMQELTKAFVNRLPSFKRITLRHLRNAADAEDAVQDAFVSAYTHLDQFKGQAQISTWLTSIVINAALMKLRRRPRQLHVALEQPDPEQDGHTFSEWLPDHRPNPEEVCRRREHTDLLARLLTKLSPTLRLTFQLRVMDGMSIRKTAQVLGVPIGTVKARVARARARLKELSQGNLRQKQAAF